MLKLDKDGQAFIRVDKPILDANSKKIGEREVEKEQEQLPELIYDVESRGYFKKLIWSVLTKRVSYVKQNVEGVQGSEFATFKPFEGYVITYYGFDADKVTSHLCANPVLYYRKMPTG